MPKELLTNINSIVSNAVLSNPDVSPIVTLYDWESSGKYISFGESQDLTDSISSYDFIIIEAVCWNTTTVFINPTCIPKPIVSSKTELNMEVGTYLLDLFCHNPDLIKRISIKFPKDNTISITGGTNLGGGDFTLGIRNIYGVKNKVSTLPSYSLEETPVAIWMDGRTVYRRIMDFGIIQISSTKNVEISYDIPNIDRIISLQCFSEYESSNMLFPIPYVYGGNSTYIYSVDNNKILINNISTQWLGSRLHGIIEYIKKEVSP